MGYLGNNSTLTGTQNNVRISATATADQTDFTVGGGYQVGAIDVYRNGVKLNAGNDFTASNGSTVTLVGAATAGDTIEFVVFESFEVSGAVSKSGDSTINGALTATSFSGDGSSVTGVSADGLSATASVNTTGIITASNGFSGNISGVAGTFTGNVSGVNGTFTGNVTIGGTLTYEDVTNIDSVGLITARNGLQVLAGITTISGQTNLTNTNVTAGIATVAGQANLANVNVSAAGTVATLSATTATVSGQTTLSNVNVSSGIATVAGQTTLANVNVATGIATVAGQTNLANLNISGFTTSNVNYFNNVAEKMVRVSAAGSVGICTYSSTANILYFDAPNGDAVIKVTGVPQDSSFDNSSIVVSAILRTTGTGRSVHPYLNINGVDRSIKFSGGSRNEATSGVTTTNGYTIYSFIGINTAGSASTAANYEVLGAISGGFF